jgi:hypothetical protein
MPEAIKVFDVKRQRLKDNFLSHTDFYRYYLSSGGEDVGTVEYKFPDVKLNPDLPYILIEAGSSFTVSDACSVMSFDFSDQSNNNDNLKCVFNPKGTGPIGSGQVYPLSNFKKMSGRVVNGSNQELYYFIKDDFFQHGSTELYYYKKEAGSSYSTLIADRWILLNSFADSLSVTVNANHIDDTTFLWGFRITQSKVSIPAPFLS